MVDGALGFESVDVGLEGGGLFGGGFTGGLFEGGGGSGGRSGVDEDVDPNVVLPKESVVPFMTGEVQSTVCPVSPSCPLP